jgi:hypothetical protein
MPIFRVLVRTGVLFCLLASLRGASGQDSGLSIELAYRALQPGEVIQAKLSASVPLRQAHLRFSGKKYVCWRDDRTGSFVSYLGLDLGSKPGPYSIEASALTAEGSLFAASREIHVLPKKFPVKRLRVEEKYVTPPPEVMERIRTESALLGSVFSIYTEEWLGEGNFVLPTDGDAVPNFGERRFFNDQPRSPHSGIDISSPRGTPVMASNSGRVVLAAELYFAGKTVVVDHGLGIFSFYGHFSKLRVVRGARIRKGDVIGEVGSTGRVTGPHLHWSVRVRGSRVDPLSLMSLILD